MQGKEYLDVLKGLLEISRKLNTLNLDAFIKVQSFAISMSERENPAAVEGLKLQQDLALTLEACQPYSRKIEAHIKTMMTKK